MSKKERLRGDAGKKRKKERKAEEKIVHGHGHAHGDGDAHAHAHAHGDGDAHAHAHGHGDGDAAVAPHGASPLERGAGAGKWLFFDCPSGIAGDMTVAALLDLGVPLGVVERALGTLGLAGYRLEVGRGRKGALAATHFEVLLEGRSPERSYRAIDALLAAAQGLDPPARELARAIFRRLAEAEAEVHGLPLAEVTFHEVGAVDSIVDVVGAAAALAYLGAEVAGSPLPLGHGCVQTRHGPLPLPAPATVLCLRGVPTYGANIAAELVTPTGAAILATAARRFVRWPSFVPERIGLGAGRRELEDRTNVLRVVLGSPSPVPSEAPEGATHLVLEANVDDLTGELAAHAIDALLESGALDAWATPITMKKGRPALQLSALATAARAADVAAVLLRETSSLGLRRTPVSRIELPRHWVEVETRFGRLPVKVSEPVGAPAHAKPEFDACLGAARAHGVPVREVLAEALAAYLARRG
jgi:pyridinium-3,5-bisthiocarboxylic acid mononucleotide nickel chelatase